MQARYGWTDAEVDALPLARYLEVEQRAMQEWDDDQKRQTILASFTSYQVIAYLGGFGENVPAFAQYLRNIGVEVE